MGNFDNIRFKGTFRTYQQKVLDSAKKHLRDGRIHIVAAPGSGKTILGCELIRQLNKPCLIFSPTVTIKNQWGDRFSSWFLNSEEEASELISYDLYNIKLINTLTYQSLYSAMEKIASADEEESVDYSQIDLFDIIEKKGIKTICLDEAHHLKNEWQKALEKFVSQLDGGIKVISLTATPPYDSSETEWDRYISVCGPIDEEIFVPELVKQKTLCPHQDFIYFSHPTETERKMIDIHRQNVAGALNEISKLDCISNVYYYLQQNHTRIYKKLYTNLKELTSLLVFFKYCEIKVENNLIKCLTGLDELPQFDNIHAEIALNYFLNAEYVSIEDKATVLGILKKYQLLERKKACITSTEKIDKTLSASMSKLDSITEIVHFESESLQDNLRMLVLTDFIKKDDIKNINTTKGFEDISIVSIFETLRRKNCNYKLGVLSGALVILPTVLHEKLNETLGLKETDFSFKEIKGTDFSIFNFKGGNKHKVNYVSKLFELGFINILIGTKSLLGEGWDSPCINSLILASFIGSFVLSNQMRGRAIRIYKNDPNKCSNIWHLVTLDGTNKKAKSTNDYQVLSRRFDNFVGPNYKTGEIESGIARIENNILPISVKNISAINASTKELAKNRQLTTDQWIIDTQNSTEVSMETRIPVSKALPSFNKTILPFLSIVLVLQVFLGIVIFKLPLLFKVVLGVLYLALIIYMLPKLLKLFIKFWRHKNAKSSIKTLSSCILDTLIFKGEIEKTYKIQVDRYKKEKFVRVCLLDASIKEQSVFSTTLKEFFSLVVEPRYILIYRNNLNIRDYNRSFMCPKIFDDNKKTVQCLLDNLKMKSTNFEAIYIKNETSMFNLRKCVKESYLWGDLDEIATLQRVVKR